MKMLLYAGCSDDDLRRQNGEINPTLRLRADGKELDPEQLVGKTIRVVRNNPLLGLIVEIEEDK